MHASKCVSTTPIRYPVLHCVACQSHVSEETMEVWMNMHNGGKQGRAWSGARRVAAIGLHPKEDLRGYGKEFLAKEDEFKYKRADSRSQTQNLSFGIVVVDDGHGLGDRPWCQLRLTGDHPPATLLARGDPMCDCFLRMGGDHLKSIVYITRLKLKILFKKTRSLTTRGNRLLPSLFIPPTLPNCHHQTTDPDEARGDRRITVDGEDGSVVTYKLILASTSNTEYTLYLFECYVFFGQNKEDMLGKKLRASIASTFYKGLGTEETDVFVLDGAKCDITRLQDIKSANILLDKNFHEKVRTFNLNNSDR
ncbi:hypothetical protein Sjap_020001 [Stephania japonica]|uniref:Uncharacterized protein n=1 Tax=Stephania japonica TaxID=461633 RepID=A0AAP0HYM9_9MAGN